MNSYSVGTTAVQIDSGSRFTVIVNNGSAPIFIGWDNTVTTNNGLPIAVGGTLSLQAEGNAVWAISTANQDVRVLNK